MIFNALHAELNFQQMTFYNFLFYFSKEIGFDVLCQLSPQETICM